MDERVDPVRPRRPERGDRVRGQLVLAQDAGPQGVVDVVVYVRHPIDQPHDAALLRGRQGRATGVAEDAVAHRIGEVQALDVIDDAQRVLVVAEVAAEALLRAPVEHLLADVPEGRMPEIVAEPDRLDEILVQRQRARDRPRDLGHLERVRQPRAVVIALRRDEDLRLVLQAPERLGVHDPVAIALEGRAQPAVGSGRSRSAG